MLKKVYLFALFPSTFRGGKEKRRGDMELGMLEPEEPEGDLDAKVLEEVENVVVGAMAPSTRAAYAKYSRLYEEYRAAQSLSYGDGSVLGFLQSRANNAEKPWKASTLQTVLSCVKRYLALEKDFTLGGLDRIQDYLKSLGKDQLARKAPAFTKENVFDFLRKRASEGAGLVEKLILAIGYFGALRCAEVEKLRFSDIEDREDTGFFVQLGRTKTNPKGGDRKLVPRLSDEAVCPYLVFVEYKRLVDQSLGKVREGDDRALFLRWHPERKKFENRKLGKEKIREVPTIVARFLGLPMAEEYTGHSLRVSSATALANSGASLTSLKRHGRWSSTSVAEGYVRDSDAVKVDEASALCVGAVKPVAPRDGHDGERGRRVLGGTFLNCVFNIGGCTEVKVGQPGEAAVQEEERGVKRARKGGIEEEQ
jgi:integrase